MTYSAKILTVSDSVARGSAVDLAGPALAERLAREGFTVVEVRVAEDGIDPVAEALTELTEGFHGLVVTTGGTGFAPRDVTPEATAATLDRLAPGLAEAMRGSEPAGRLSRAIAGTRGKAIVLNTPGSPSGAVQFLEAVVDVLPHALDVLAGQPGHGHVHNESHTSEEPRT
ncbi:MAG: MogA/MoaB family molybdenum cofactor biosynthesis protein [Acidimicrobiales bacterium]